MSAHKGVRGMDALRGRAVAIAVMAVALLAIGGPSARAASPSPSASGDVVTLRIGTTSDADTINPFTMLETLSFEAVGLTYNQLFDLDVNGQSRPMLAAEMPTLENGGITADGKTVTVKLKPDLKWSDGTPLTAEDVAWTYNYYVDNAAVLPNMGLGAKGIERTVAVDATTVRIECAAPKADLFDTYLPILPKHIWGEVAPEKAGSTLSQHPAARRQRPLHHPGVEAGLLHEADAQP